MAQEVAAARVRMLIDAYQLLVEHQPLAKVAPAILHVHVAQGIDRISPSGHDTALAAFFTALRSNG